MKISVILLFILTSLTAMAGPSPGAIAIRQERIQSEFGLFEYPEIGYCRYEIVGEGVLMEAQIEEKLMNLPECLTKGKHFLNTSEKSYSKVLIKHQSQTKWITIERK